MSAKRKKKFFIVCPFVGAIGELSVGHHSLMGEESAKESRSRVAVRAAGLVALAAILLPFLYLTTVALLLSAYVHNLTFPSRGFLKSYAIPSNGLCGLPAVGVVYSNYCRACIKLSGGDRESMRTDGNR